MDSDKTISDVAIAGKGELPLGRLIDMLLEIENTYGKEIPVLTRGVNSQYLLSNGPVITNVSFKNDEYEYDCNGLKYVILD